MSWLSLIRHFFRLYKRNNPADLDVYEARMREEIGRIAVKLGCLSGTALLDAIADDKKGLQDTVADSEGVAMLMVGMFAAGRIDSIGKELTGEEHVSNYISKSVEHNVTSQMGIALAEVADVIRRSPAVVEYIEHETRYDAQALSSLEGGAETAAALAGFLAQYGMRCTGEIDITRARFHENPAELFPMLVSNIKTLPTGHGTVMFEKGLSDSKAKIDELLRLCEQKCSARKAKKLAHQIDIFRNFAGAREYPKYFWMCRYDVYKKALIKEAERLADDGVIERTDDIYYLYFDELREVVKTGKSDKELIEKRRSDYRFYKTLTPPRVLFSDGEIPPPEYAADVPSGALPGLAVSGGSATGRARVIKSVDEAHIEKGDILVTTFTDPSWTPVFVSIAALVTEVGGMMTHGSVITREYGLPAVVGVVDATALIKDGDRIKVDGDKGFVEILERCK